jgi:hypothetical protein
MYTIYIMAYFNKARTVEPEKQPLLANDSETFGLGNSRGTDNGTTSVARHQILNKNKSPLLGNGSVNAFPLQRISIPE